jgi:hypothetical protein
MKRFNKNIPFIHENNFVDKKKYIAITFFFIFIISNSVLFYNLMKNIYSQSSIIAIFFANLLMPIIFALIIMSYRESKFIYNNQEIVKIVNPPIILHMLLNIEFVNGKMHITHSDDMTKGICIEVDYKFYINTYTQQFPMYYNRTYIPYAYQIYVPSYFNITIHKDNQEVYKEDLEYYENLYFSNWKNNNTMNIDKFIKTAINDAMQAIIPKISEI